MIWFDLSCLCSAFPISAIKQESCFFFFVDSSVDSSTDGEICKYYASATGCARGSTCFYRHGEEEQWSLKSKANLARSTVLAEFKRKIFVGGLPPDLDSGMKFTW